MLANYNVKLPKFTPQEVELLSQLENKFLMKYSARLSRISREERTERAKEILMDEVKHMKKEISDKEINEMLSYISGYNVIDSLITEDAIEEILINGADVPVMIYHRTLGKCKTNIQFKNKDELNKLIEKILIFCGLSSKKPIIDAVLPDGPRINCTLPPVSFDSSVVTIRKYLENPPTIIDLIKNGTMTADMASLIWVCVEGFGLAPRNILISGGTSCGKTTLLNSIIPFVREYERLVSIEDTMELDLEYCDDWVRTTTSEYADMEKLVENSLRLRPDRVVVGEVRGKEAFNLINAMNLGHTGMGTIHADSARDAILKLTSPPMNVDPRMLVVLDLIIVLTRFHEGKTSKRMITHIDEVGGIMESQIQLGSVYRYNAKSKKTDFSRFPAVTINKMSEIAGLTPKDVIDEIRKREMVLKYLVAKDITDLGDFINFIRSYYEEPQKVLNMIMLEKRMVKKMSETNGSQRGE
ncbi:MAG: CpaF family protein [Candidatus Altiarchaeota archaeon]|nr:CpaF family protein [Candidatus Altiarchaeota archaeon]